MKMGSAARLRLWDGLKEDCHAWFHFQGLSRERICERASEKALVGYCSSIFLGRTRAVVRAWLENAEC